MNFKKFLLILLSVSLCLPLAACNDATVPSDSETKAPSDTGTTQEDSSDTSDTSDTAGSNEPTPDGTPEIKEQSYALSSFADQIKLNGRAYAAEGGIVCDHGADGIEFNAYVDGDVTVSISATRDAYFTLFVDGKRMEERLKVNAGDTALTLPSESGKHHFRLLKQTESMDTLTVLKTLSFTGYLAEKPSNGRVYIEFIGDSLTSGYGILGNPQTQDGGAPIYKDATLSHAFLAAEALKADCSLVSCTGIGVVRGYRDFPIASFYPKTSYYRNAETDYVSTRTPDAVVINLGTNDRSKQVSSVEFEPAAKELIAQIQTLHGKDVPIVWVLNANVTSLNPTIKRIMNDLGGESAGFYTVEIALDSLGGGGHPSQSSQATEAQKIYKFLKNELSF